MSSSKRQSPLLAASQSILALCRSHVLFLYDMEQDEYWQFPLLSEEEIEQGQVVTKLTVFHPTTFNCETSDASKLDVLVMVDNRILKHFEFVAGALTPRCQRNLPRNATCIQVLPVSLPDKSVKLVIVVGEKTGEAIALPFPNFKSVDDAKESNLKSLLGHTTSMLTDVAYDSYHHFLLTADRDEKIRVSNFPQTDIIQAYCLGHTAAVANVVSLSTAANRDLAISLSLDKTIKLWNVTNGQLLDSMDIEHELDATDMSATLVDGLVAVKLNARSLLLIQITNNKMEVIKEEEMDVASVKFLDNTDLAVATTEGLQLYALERENGIQLARKNGEKLEKVQKAAGSIELKVLEETEEDVDDGLQKKRLKVR